MDTVALQFVKTAHSGVDMPIGLIFERQDGGSYMALLERENARELLRELDRALGASESPGDN